MHIYLYRRCVRIWPNQVLLTTFCNVHLSYVMSCIMLGLKRCQELSHRVVVSSFADVAVDTLGTDQSKYMYMYMWKLIRFTCVPKLCGYTVSYLCLKSFLPCNSQIAAAAHELCWETGIQKPTIICHSSIKSYCTPKRKKRYHFAAHPFAGLVATDRSTQYPAYTQASDCSA